MQVQPDGDEPVAAGVHVSLEPDVATVRSMLDQEGLLSGYVSGPGRMRRSVGAGYVSSGRLRCRATGFSPGTPPLPPECRPNSVIKTAATASPCSRGAAIPGILPVCGPISLTKPVIAFFLLAIAALKFKVSEII